MSHTAFRRTCIAAGLAVLLATLVLFMVVAPIVVTAGESPTPDATFQLQPAASASTLCFVNAGISACVDRVGIQSTGTLTEQVRSLAGALVAGPTASERAQGIQSALPPGARLVDVSATAARTVIRLELPASYLSTFDAGDAEDVNAQVATTLTPFDLARMDIEVRDPAQPSLFRPLSSFLPPVSIPTKPGEASSALPSSTDGGQPPVNGQPQSGGGLGGKTVFVSAGHGWYWLSSQSRYRTQRPTYPNAPYPAGQGIVEDFNNAEVVNQYLLEYLWNAGADAWTVRERDMITTMLIVDNSSPAFSTQGGWSNGMGGYNGSYVSIGSITSGAPVTATWTFTPALAAKYAVYAWFPGAGATDARTPAARYRVEHAGGATVLTVTQQRDSSNWRYIGTYPFRAGVAGRVRLTNQSSVAGKTVLADAIRIGGGLGDQSVAGAPVSGKPRWEEQARQYAKWVGLPDADALNDVIVRPIYSEWEAEVGEDAIYISWHTNGYNGYNTTARGTETYIHSFEPTPKSDVLQDYVHAELLHDIRGGWEASWPDRGQKAQDLGELRLLESMPGVLIENGYHDNPQDVEAEKDPRFNLLSARAVYQGLVRYWHAQDPNVPLVFLPEPPAQLRLRNSGPNQVTLAWQPGPTDATGLLGDVATSYRVYTSTDGFGWGNAINTPGLSLALSGLAPGQLIYARVTGVNAGGESFPTPSLAARVAANDVAPALIVHGFDRIDRHGLIQQFDGAEGNNRRMLLDRINRYDYVIQYAAGITHAFDSAVHAAVTEGKVGLGNYAVVAWIGGEEQSPDVALNATDQTLLQAFLDSGGALLISGAELGFDLSINGAGPAFYNNVLRASFVADDANTYGVSATGGGVFSGLPPFAFDDGTHGTYDVDFPDVFTPMNGAQSALLYNGGGTAALSYSSGSCIRLIYMGFPLETIYPQSVRQEVVARAFGFLDACVPSTGPDTAILSPVDGAAYNPLPPFNGAAGGPNGVTSVQVAILSGTLYYNGSTFVPPETWLPATGTATWSYGLPSSLNDGDYTLKARAIESGVISDTTPAVVTFTRDRVAPATPVLITPTGGITLGAIAATFSWTGSGNPSGFVFELDGVSETLSSPALGITRTVAQGAHTWRVRAFDRAGNASGWSATETFRAVVHTVYLPILSQNFTSAGTPAPTCYEAIVNGGFETTGGWTINYGPAAPPAYVSAPSQVHSGARSMRSGIDGQVADTNSYSSFTQTVSIPANAVSASLSFWRYRKSTDTVNDLQMLRLTNSNGGVDYLVYEKVNDPHWTEAQSDLLEHAGTTVTLYFNTINNTPAGTTAVYIDDVSLQVCTP
ncbi:MAG TPA: N-acetylmuramoyl-L-alanine amidase [Anaerolineae bacterium]|nr:N-acetylmuramoyl-L-alanine amidase [Anaerolineae bacterium]